jgi:hypothetical protein
LARLGGAPAADRDDRYVERLHRLAIEQLERSYTSEIGESPWTESPRYRIAQLRVALVERILVGERGHALNDGVATAIADVQAAIDEGVGASTTMGARETALLLVEAIVRNPALTADLPAGRSGSSRRRSATPQDD